MFAGIQSHPWAYPALEIVHICGIALLLGNLVLVEARVFGRGAVIPLQPLARLSLTIAVLGFLVAAASGLLMFASQPGELLANGAFTLKLGLMFAAGCNAAFFHARDSLGKADLVARASMALSTLLWLGVTAAGRWIAYN
jgi:hypothetical protein